MSFAKTVIALAPYLWLRLNDSSGTVALDSSGNKRNGTYVGAVTLKQPGFTNDGNSSVLTSSTGAIQLPSGAGLTNAAFTLAFFVKPSSLITNSNLAGTGVAAQSSGWYLKQSGTTLALFVNNTSVGSCVNAYAGLAAGSVVLIRVTYDGSGNWTVSVNDSPTPCITATGAVLTAPTGSPTVEVGTFNGQTFAIGSYQDIMLFSSVLTTANFVSVYDAALGGVTPTTGNMVTPYKTFSSGVGGGLTKTFYRGIPTAVSPTVKALLLSKGLVY